MEKMTPEQWVAWCRERNTDVHWKNNDRDGERVKRKMFIRKFEDCVSVPLGEEGYAVLRRAGYKPLPELEHYFWVQTEFGLPYNVRRNRHAAFNNESSRCSYLFSHVTLPEDVFARAFARSPIIKEFCEMMNDNSVTEKFRTLNISQKQKLAGMFGIKRTRGLSICNWISQTKEDKLSWHKYPEADHIDRNHLRDTEDNCVFDPDHARKSAASRKDTMPNTAEGIQAEIDRLRKKQERLRK